MANDYGNPNPDIARLGQGTQFGEDRPPQSATKGRKPWSVRNALRRIAAMDQEQLKEFAADPRLTMAQLVALKKFQVATGKNPNVKAQQQIEDSMDGKVVQAQVNAGVSLADLIAGSYKEPHHIQDQEDENEHGE